MRALLVLAMLAGCGPVVAVVAIPDELRSCPAKVASPLPPPKPRSVESIADWGNRTTVALEIADQRLVECDRRRAAAVGLIR